MAVNEKLANLLSQKYFLSKILIHLIDSRLHECRRVCRLWCEVCNQLPVKLKLSLNENVAAVSDIFPNAAVSLEVRADAADEDDGFVETLLASCMSSLRNIRHLVLGQTVEWPLLLDKLEPNTESLQSLLSLSVELTNQLNHSTTLDFLKFLTALTALTLEGEPEDVQNSDPITEIQNLKSLAISLPFLANRNGRLLFAASSQLTRLDILPTNHSVHFDIPLLQVSPYRLNT